MAKKPREEDSVDEVDPAPTKKKAGKKKKSSSSPSPKGWDAQRSKAKARPSGRESSALPSGSHSSLGMTVGGVKGRNSPREAPKSILHTHSRPKNSREPFGR